MLPAPPTFTHSACLACGLLPAALIARAFVVGFYLVPVYHRHRSALLWVGWLKGGGELHPYTPCMAPSPPTFIDAACLARSLLFWWHSLCFGYQFPLIIVTVQLRRGVGNSHLFQGFFPWLSCILCHYQLSQTDPQPCGCALMGGLHCQWSSRTNTDEC
jgi:hypothetical protein